MAYNTLPEGNVERDMQIIHLANQGLRAVDVAQRLRMSRTNVATRMSALMKSGKLKRAIERRGSVEDAKQRGNIMYQRYKIKLGFVSDALMQLDIEQCEWLFEQVPHGMTLAEYLGAIARDVYAEAHGDE